MTITPAIKGQLTKAINPAHNLSVSTTETSFPKLWVQVRFARVCAIFAKHMPRQQAKHAARKYLAKAI